MVCSVKKGVEALAPAGDDARRPENATSLLPTMTAPPSGLPRHQSRWPESPAFRRPAGELVTAPTSWRPAMVLSDVRRRLSAGPWRAPAGG